MIIISAWAKAEHAVAGSNDYNDAKFGIEYIVHYQDTNEEGFISANTEYHDWQYIMGYVPIDPDRQVMLITYMLNK